MSLAVIVQARFGSSRLPGKTLEPLGEKPALLRCLDRCAKIAGAQAVTAAIADTPADDAVAALARRGGYRVVRGPEQDVLRRYALAAEGLGAAMIMRVTSDCPFLDPELARRGVDLKRDSGADYVSNGMPPGFPHGLDFEIFEAAMLAQADAQSVDPYEREHVTAWIKRRPGLRTANLAGPAGVFAAMRWTLDYPEDLTFCRAVFEAMGEHAATASAAEIAALCLRRPDIAAINRAFVIDRTPDKPAQLQTAPVSLDRAA